MKEKLGVIRIVTVTGTFEVPYSEDNAFINTVVLTRSNGGFQNEALFVPYHSIGYMVKVPDGTPIGSEFDGMTKQ